MPIDAETQAGIRIIHKKAKDLSEKEIQTVMNFYKQYLSEGPIPNKKDEYAIKMFEKDLKKGKESVWLAQKIHGKKIVGVSTAYFIKRKSDGKNRLVISPYFTCVSKEYRGKGLGSRLMLSRVGLARKRGAMLSSALQGGPAGKVVVGKHNKLTKNFSDIKKETRRAKRTVAQRERRRIRRRC